MTRSKWTVAVLVLFAGAFVAAAAEEAKNLLKDPSKAESWRLEQHEQGKAALTAEEGGVAFDVTTAGAENWHVQAFLTELGLEEGKEYTFTYKAKGEPARTIMVAAGIDEDDWHAIGLQEEFEVGKEWKEQTHTFKAEGVAKNNKNRIGFVLGADKGKVWIKDAKLTEKSAAAAAK
jgi:hypothetical protein